MHFATHPLVYNMHLKPCTDALGGAPSLLHDLFCGPLPLTLDKTQVCRAGCLVWVLRFKKRDAGKDRYLFLKFIYLFCGLVVSGCVIRWRLFFPRLWLFSLLCWFSWMCHLRRLALVLLSGRFSPDVLTKIGTPPQRRYVPRGTDIQLFSTLIYFVFTPFYSFLGVAFQRLIDRLIYEAVLEGTTEKHLKAMILLTGVHAPSETFKKCECKVHGMAT